MKRKQSAIICNKTESRSYGYQCEKGFTAEAVRRGINSHCLKCIKEGEDEA